MPEGWLTTDEAAGVMRVNPSRVRQCCANGEVVSERTGKIWLVKKASAEAYAMRPNRKPRKEKKP